MAMLADGSYELSPKLILEQFLKELPWALTPQPESSSLSENKMSPDYVESGEGNDNSNPYPTVGAKQSMRVHCEHPGCDRDFSRRSDRDRHDKAIHKNIHFECGCCKNQGYDPVIFSRFDKLLDHLRKQHRVSGQRRRTQCRYPECKDLSFSSSACLALHETKDHKNGNAMVQEDSIGPSIGTSVDRCLCANKLHSVSSNGLISEHIERPRHGSSTIDFPGTNLPRIERPIIKLHKAEHPILEPQGPSETLSTEPPIKRIKGSDMPSNGSLFSLSGSSRLEGEWPNTFSGLLSPWSDITPTDSRRSTAQTDLSLIPDLDFGDTDLMSPNGWDFHSPTQAVTQDVTQASVNYQSKILRDSGNIKPTGVIDSYVPEVQPADFALMHALKLFTDIEHRLMLSPDDVPYPSIQHISYNVKSSRITLRGKQNGMHGALDLLKRNLRFISEWQGLDLLPGSNGHRRSTIRESLSNFTHSTTSRTSQQSDSENKERVFAFNAQDNPDDYDTWRDVLMPDLPGILSDSVGANYCACLVRMGSDELDAEPCIQVETSYLLGPQTQENIFNRIKALIELHQRRSIHLVFKIGSFVQLARLRATGYSSLGGEDKGRYQFSYNRPWPRPGMGTPVGMRCCYDVSGTLGGFLQIKDKLCILTCAHMVSDARERGGGIQDQNSKEELVSPPQDVLDDLDEWLQIEIHEGRAMISKDMARLAEDKIRQGGDGDITPEDLSSGFTSDRGLALMDKDDVRWQARKQFRSRTDKRPKVIGRLLKMKEQPRESTTLRRADGRGPSIDGKVYMDWAVHEAKDEGNQGTNRHRYQSAADAWKAMEPGAIISEGDLCEETCDPSNDTGDPSIDTDVHYVGRMSGHRKCQVNSAVMICSHKGYKFNSWFALQSGKSINDREVQGDSGSWLIRNSDNKVLGQLIGCSTEKLLFTPINDILDHIKEAFGTDQVCLPKRAPEVPLHPTAQMHTISYKRPPKNIIALKRGFLTPPPSPSDSCVNNTPSLSITASSEESVILESTSPSTPKSLATTTISTFNYKNERAASSRSQYSSPWQLCKAIQSRTLSSPLTVSNRFNLAYPQSSDNAKKCDLSYILNNSEQLGRLTSVLKKPAETLFSMIKSSSKFAINNESSTQKQLLEYRIAEATPKRSMTAPDQKKARTSRPPVNLLPAPEFQSLPLRPNPPPEPSSSWLLNEPLSRKIPRVQTV